MVKQLLPALRAGFRLYESYTYSTGELFACPITVFGGLQDSTVHPRDLDAWRYQTTGTFSLHMVPGNHLFIHSDRDHILRTLTIEIQNTLPGLEE